MGSREEGMVWVQEKRVWYGFRIRGYGMVLGQRERVGNVIWKPNYFDTLFSKDI